MCQYVWSISKSRYTYPNGRVQVEVLPVSESAKRFPSTEEMVSHSAFTGILLILGCRVIRRKQARRLSSGGKSPNCTWVFAKIPEIC